VAIGLFPVSRKRKTQQNASRDEARRTLREDRNQQILALIKKGVSQIEAARILGIGKNTVYRVLKKLREAAAVIENVVASEPITKKTSRHQNGAIYVNTASAQPVDNLDPMFGLLDLPLGDSS
jgi:transposase-like protein